MYNRLLTFRKARDIDDGIAYVREEAVPVLRSQHGYGGVFASANRGGALLSILSRWETEADRAASDSALGKAREEVVKIVGGELTLEKLEELALAVTKPPTPGCSLIATRLSMEPASIDENLRYFKSEVLPVIKAQPGFCALRNMMDRQTGRGLMGTVWETRKAMETYAEGLKERRAGAMERGIGFPETAYLEVLLVDTP
jgi:heme-degrading monooxygenase HmoA